MMKKISSFAYVLLTSSLCAPLGAMELSPLQEGACAAPYQKRAVKYTLADFIDSNEISQKRWLGVVNATINRSLKSKNYDLTELYRGYALAEIKEKLGEEKRSKFGEEKEGHFVLNKDTVAFVRESLGEKQESLLKSTFGISDADWVTYLESPTKIPSLDTAKAARSFFGEQLSPNVSLDFRGAQKFEIVFSASSGLYLSVEMCDWVGECFERALAQTPGKENIKELKFSGHPALFLSKYLAKNFSEVRKIDLSGIKSWAFTLNLEWKKREMLPLGFMGRVFESIGLGPVRNERVLRYPLTSLNLSNTSLEIPLFLNFVNSAPHLTTLDLSDNKLSDERITCLLRNPAFTKLPLKELDLHGNHIDATSWRLLYAFQNTLQRVNLQKNSISAHSAKELANYLPASKLKLNHFLINDNPFIRTGETAVRLDQEIEKITRQNQLSATPAAPNSQKMAEKKRN